MRVVFSFLFTIVILVLVWCTVSARRSDKSIGRFVALLDSAFILPLLGNLIFIGAHTRLLALIGYYVYFLGMDHVMFALCRFTYEYCKGAGTKHKTPKVIYAALIVDTVQLLANVWLGHAFDIEAIVDEAKVYYRLVPLAGQVFHSIVVYGIYLSIVAIFILMSVKTARVYREKYTVLLACLLVVGILQTFYLFVEFPIDRSMIVYGLIGILIYYIAVKYRPLRFLDSMLSGVVSEMPEALFVIDPAGKCIWANPEGRKLCGVTERNYDEAVDRLVDIFGTEIREAGSKMFDKVIGEGEDAMYYCIDRENVNDERGRTNGQYIRIVDNTEEQRRLRRELHDMTHDRLTGLYNWSNLYDGIAKVIEKCPDEKFYVIFVDVRNFKIVNDVFGSEFGDLAIIRIADWIRSHAVENSVYGRLVGDTFGMCIPAKDFDQDAIEDELTHFKVRQKNIEHQLLIHLGVYEVTDRELDVSLMFDRAHLALGPIRDDYHTHVAFYDRNLRSRLLWNQNITAQLHEALENNEIQPYLQGIADKDGHIVGAEALARWIHPEKGFLSPGVFIPVFEENGMIVEVDKHIWRKACEILADWAKRGVDKFISINISPKDFYFTNVYADIMELVMEYGIDQSRLRVEITETAMMGNTEKNRFDVLNDFRESGFIVEMDDFGSGYSSLNTLKDLPVDVLKIDMKFLSQTKEDRKAKIILKNVVGLSEELGLTALTEGVETKEQFDMLSEMGCRLFQGYYFARPVSVSEFEDKYLAK